MRFVFLSIVILLAACTKKESVSSLSPQELLLKQGRSAYMARCIACHNIDPKKPGSLGPDVHGSSLELLKLRVLEAKYPEAYQPKRTTKLMQPLKDAEKDLEALHAFLNQ